MTGLRTPGQNVLRDFTVAKDYNLQFIGGGEKKFYVMVFQDEMATDLLGPSVIGVATRHVPAMNLPGFTGPQQHTNLVNIDTAHIFFHPAPFTKTAHYQDGEYSPEGWSALLDKYLIMIGLQVFATTNKQILIFPLFPTAAYNTLGWFLTDWQEAISQIVDRVGGLYDPEGGMTDRPAKIKNLVLSGFSQGIQPLAKFLQGGTNVRAMTRTVIDLDGVPGATSLGLAHGPHATFRYDQGNPPPRGPFVMPFGKGRISHVGGSRWPPDPKGQIKQNVHGEIPIFMVYDALKMSQY